jgi:hypothetical protein
MKIPVTFETVKSEIYAHSDRHSLLSISDVLDRWNVPNAAYKMEVEELSTLNIPFITYSTENGIDFLLVDKITDQEVICYNENRKKIKIGLVQFAKIYSGIALVAEPDQSSGEANYKSKRIKEIFNNNNHLILLVNGLIILAIGLYFHSRYFQLPDMGIAFASVVKCIGLAVSILLLRKSVGLGSSLVNKLCFGKNANCDLILTSKASKVLYGLVTWSEVGFFYFSGTLLLLIFNTDSSAVIQLLAFINILCLPFTFYSISYQLKVAGKWCTLCCIVLILFWLEFFILHKYISVNWAIPTSKEISHFLLSILAPLSLWLLIKPLILKTRQATELQSEISKYLSNQTLFNKVLYDQPRYELPDQVKTISLGSLHAETRVTVVLSPFCPSCVETYKALEDEFLDNKDVQIQIVFYPDINDQNGKYLVAKHLMGLYLQHESNIRKAIADWYRLMNYRSWKKLYPLEGQDNDPAVDSILSEQNKWCQQSNILFTPTVLINGFQLPEPYNLNSIKYLL